MMIMMMMMMEIMMVIIMIEDFLYFVSIGKLKTTGCSIYKFIYECLRYVKLNIQDLSGIGARMFVNCN